VVRVLMVGVVVVVVKVVLGEDHARRVVVAKTAK
jgi:hypothetical protein